MQQERESEIALVQSLRTIQETTRGNSKERNELLNEFRKIREKAQKTKAERDQINQNVPPPLEIIEQRLSETHRRLATIPNDLSKMPNRDHEVKLFSFFFELKAMYSKKVRGNELHQQYIDLLRNQDEKLKQLDKLRDERKVIAEEARQEDPGQKANPKEIRKLNDRIAEMLDAIKLQRSELKKMRRERGRLEAFSRMQKKSDKRSKRAIGIRIEDVKSRASSGGNLTMEDLGALLNSGGLQSLNEQSKEQEKQNAEAAKKPKRRQVGAARGRRRTLNTDERERRQR
tara:strand:- start:61 stop:921 length:861 start_codon:yes stop_codon:yes gene_type:complete